MPVAEEAENSVRGGGPSPGRGCLRLAVTLPPLLLALGTVTGVGMEKGIPAPLALLAATALTGFPILRLAGPESGRIPVSPLAAWLWCTLLLLMLPLYLPGERDSSTATGLRYLAHPLGPDASGGIANWGVATIGLLGDDPDPLGLNPDAEGNFCEAEPLQICRSDADVEAATAPDNAVSDLPGGELGSLFIPYQGDENSLQILVDIDGPVLGDQYAMIFDTGATLTTLDRHTVEAIGLEVSPDAPRIHLQTANGEIVAPLILVDAIWLGEAPVEWVTVAVCDRCAPSEPRGLLGLNVSQRFRVSLDHDRERIELHRRRGNRNRRLDIGPWLKIRSIATESWDGGVSLELNADNLSRRKIESAVTTLDCSGASFSIQLDDIPAGGSARTEVELPRGTDCNEQKLELSRAYWYLDRF